MSEPYNVADLNGAALLLAEDVELIDTRFLEGRKIVFIFDDAPRCANLMKSFCSGRHTINSRRFLEGLNRARDLRDLVVRNSRNV